MAERTPEQPGNKPQESTDPIESLIDEAIRSILDEAGSQVAARSRTSAAPLLDAVLSGAPMLGKGKASMLERVLVAEALADALAEALAPTLAAALAPKIMNMLESGSAGQSAERGRERARTPEGK
ncbi:hypothetical protein [Dactylosporangium sp. CA-092794]|uniref:hypothetical protein n=1 Tax=Dactylosporangium sp. CA-092794 TaxID=3239929 RepID=UPI003D8ECCE9